MRMRFSLKTLVVLLVFMLLAGCSNLTPSPTVSTPSSTVSTPSPTVSTPSPAYSETIDRMGSGL